jgi:serine/threonine protein kinase
MRFLPKAEDLLSLDLGGSQVPFRFKAHPHPGLAAAQVPHGMSGEKSSVWRLEHCIPGGDEYALKVMNHVYRDPQLPQICNYLSDLCNISGLECCDRVCLTKDNCRTIDTYAELEFAMLMPWVKGTSWFDAHQDHSSTNALSQWEAFRLARALAEVLAALESRNIVHCSLSPNNILVRSHQGDLHVELVGLEALRGANFSDGVKIRTSTFGYTHRSCTKGDSASPSSRFSGGLLIAEILGWWSQPVREDLYSAECYFEPDELQDHNSKRFRILLEGVLRQHRDLAALLDRVWHSPCETEGPSFAEWLAVIDRVAATKISYTWHFQEGSPKLDIHPRRCWADKKISQINMTTANSTSNSLGSTGASR